MVEEYSKDKIIRIDHELSKNEVQPQQPGETGVARSDFDTTIREPPTTERKPTAFRPADEKLDGYKD